jgi:hypothetical protein
MRRIFLIVASTDYFSACFGRPGQILLPIIDPSATYH